MEIYFMFITTLPYENLATHNVQNKYKIDYKH